MELIIFICILIYLLIADEEHTESDRRGESAFGKLAFKAYARHHSKMLLKSDSITLK